MSVYNRTAAALLGRRSPVSSTGAQQGSTYEGALGWGLGQGTAAVSAVAVVPGTSQVELLEGLVVGAAPGHPPVEMSTGRAVLSA